MKSLKQYLSSFGGGQKVLPEGSEIPSPDTHQQELLSRRNFLKQAALISAAVLFSTKETLAQNKSPQELFSQWKDQHPDLSQVTYNEKTGNILFKVNTDADAQKLIDSIDTLSQLQGFKEKDLVVSTSYTIIPPLNSDQYKKLGGAFKQYVISVNAKPTTIPLTEAPPPPPPPPELKAWWRMFLHPAATAAEVSALAYALYRFRTHTLRKQKDEAITGKRTAEESLTQKDAELKTAVSEKTTAIENYKEKEQRLLEIVNDIEAIKAAFTSLSDPTIDDILDELSSLQQNNSILDEHLTNAESVLGVADLSPEQLIEKLTFLLQEQERLQSELTTRTLPGDSTDSKNKYENILDQDELQAISNLKEKDPGASFSISADNHIEKITTDCAEFFDFSVFSELTQLSALLITHLKVTGCVKLSALMAPESIQIDGVETLGSLDSVATKIKMNLEQYPALGSVKLLKPFSWKGQEYNYTFYLYKFEGDRNNYIYENGELIEKSAVWDPGIPETTRNVYAIAYDKVLGTDEAQKEAINQEILTLLTLPAPAQQAMLGKYHCTLEELLQAAWHANYLKIVARDPQAEEYKKNCQDLKELIDIASLANICRQLSHQVGLINLDIERKLVSSQAHQDAFDSDAQVLYGEKEEADRKLTEAEKNPNLASFVQIKEEFENLLLKAQKLKKDVDDFRPPESDKKTDPLSVIKIIIPGDVTVNDLNAALDYMKQHKKISHSLLSVHLGNNGTLASSVLRALEQSGIIGPAQGNPPENPIFINPDTIENFESEEPPNETIQFLNQLSAPERLYFTDGSCLIIQGRNVEGELYGTYSIYDPIVGSQVNASARIAFSAPNAWSLIRSVPAGGEEVVTVDIDRDLSREYSFDHNDKLSYSNLFTEIGELAAWFQNFFPYATSLGTKWLDYNLLVQTFNSLLINLQLYRKDTTKYATGTTIDYSLILNDLRLTSADIDQADRGIVLRIWDTLKEMSRLKADLETMPGNDPASIEKERQRRETIEIFSANLYPFDIYEPDGNRIEGRYDSSQEVREMLTDNYLLAIGDLHASALKMIETLILGGLVTLPPDKAKKFKELYEKMAGIAAISSPPEQDRQVDYAAFATKTQKDEFVQCYNELIPILESLDWIGGDRQFLMIGDVLLDRGLCDALAMLIIKILREKAKQKGNPKPFVILASNHDLAERLGYRDTLILGPELDGNGNVIRAANDQTASWQRARYVESQSNLENLYDEYLMQTELFYHDSQANTTFAHAEVNFDLLARLWPKYHKSISSNTIERAIEGANSSYRNNIQDNVPYGTPLNANQQLIYDLVWAGSNPSDRSDRTPLDRGNAPFYGIISCFVYGHHKLASGEMPFADAKYRAINLDQDTRKNDEMGRIFDPSKILVLRKKAPLLDDDILGNLSFSGGGGGSGPDPDLNATSLLDQLSETLDTMTAGQFLVITLNDGTTRAFRKNSEGSFQQCLSAQKLSDRKKTPQEMKDDLSKLNITRITTNAQLPPEVVFSPADSLGEDAVIHNRDDALKHIQGRNCKYQSHELRSALYLLDVHDTNRENGGLFVAYESDQQRGVPFQLTGTWDPYGPAPAVEATLLVNDDGSVDIRLAHPDGETEQYHDIKSMSQMQLDTKLSPQRSIFHAAKTGDRIYFKDSDGSIDGTYFDVTERIEKKDSKGTRVESLLGNYCMNQPGAKPKQYQFSCTNGEALLVEQIYFPKGKTRFSKIPVLNLLESEPNKEHRQIAMYTSLQHILDLNPDLHPGNIYSFYNAFEAQKWPDLMERYLDTVFEGGSGRDILGRIISLVGRIINQYESTAFFKQIQKRSTNPRAIQEDISKVDVQKLSVNDQTALHTAYDDLTRAKSLLDQVRPYVYLVSALRSYIEVRDFLNTVPSDQALLDTPIRGVGMKRNVDTYVQQLKSYKSQVSQWLFENLNIQSVQGASSFSAALEPATMPGLSPEQLVWLERIHPSIHSSTQAIKKIRPIVEDFNTGSS